MTSRVEITESELREALASLSVAPSEARTVRQLAALWGLSDKSVRSRLQRLHDAGRLVRHTVRAERIDGTIVSVPAYTLKPDG